MTRLQRGWAWLRLLGSGRLRMALAGAALAATLVTGGLSLPAHADPTPTPSATSPTPAAPAPATPPAGGTPAPTAEEMEQIEQILKEQNEKLSGAAQEEMLRQQTERLRKQLPHEGGVLGVFNVTDAHQLPVSAYTVRGDTGGLTDWDLGIYNLITEFCFMITKWLIAFCCWLIAWALSFGLAKILLAPVLTVAQSLHARVILEMGLPTLFLAVCALICVARIFFGDRARGWGDAALSLMLAALTTTLLSSTPQLLLGPDTGAIAATRGLALEVASVVVDASPPAHTPASEATPASLSRPLTDALVNAFVVQPAMLLQYGQTFDGECAQAYADTKLSQLAYDRQVSARTNRFKKLPGLANYLPGGSLISSWYDTQIDMTRRWAVDHFGNPPTENFEKKCVHGDVGAAKKASLDKVGGSVFLLVAAIIVTILLIGLTGSFLVAQCRIAWDAVRGEFALVAGTVPGPGRGVLWDWCASVLRSLAQMLYSVIALAVFIVVVQAVLNPVQQEWGRELTLRFILLDIVCIGAVKKRKDITARTHQLASGFRAKMASGRIGGTSLAPAATPLAKSPRIGRGLVRGVVRGGLVGVSLAQGNPLAALGYAMPRTIGATALMTRLSTARRRRRPGPPRSARPAGRPLPPPAAPPAVPPQPAVPPLPATVPQPATGSTGPARGTGTPPAQRAARRAAQRSARRAAQRRPQAPRQVPRQPTASARQQQLRQRLNRRTNRHTATGTTAAARRASALRRNRRGRGGSNSSAGGTP
ncbi:hypothetical protein [Streptomyces sp. CBMA152]|uniref:hypothetical protein n=1 Tax=Streptomyces sp. CBMA152 TaxID=1896312 RepID=UPI00166010B7|nr:hypothetical protein [Streptomyces sp. CBMA152]MBD0742998.1 hypothetical protein [Streptomyces sp. CBMA152]